MLASVLASVLPSEVASEWRRRGRSRRCPRAPASHPRTGRRRGRSRRRCAPRRPRGRALLSHGAIVARCCPARSGASRVCPSHRARRPARSAGVGGSVDAGRGDAVVLLAAQVGLHRPAAEDDLPSAYRGGRPRAGRGAGHPRQQPPVLLRLVVHAAGDPPPGDVRGEGRDFEGHGLKGWLQRRSSRAPARFRSTGRAAGPRRGRCDGVARPRQRRVLRHLSRGHPQPRRPAVPRPHRGRPGRAGGRRCRSSRSPSSAPTWSCPPARCSAATPDRWCASAATDFSRYEGMELTATSCARSPRMITIMELSGQEYVFIYATKAPQGDSAGGLPGTFPDPGGDGAHGITRCSSPR